MERAVVDSGDGVSEPSLELLDRHGGGLLRVELSLLLHIGEGRPGQKMDAITLEQANSAIRKYYQRDNLTFVILGAADKIRESVKKYYPQATEVSVKDAGWGGY